MTAPSPDDIRFVRKFPDACCAEITRRGELYPCDKAAVAVAVNAEDGEWWPVCAFHTRGKHMVPLHEVIAAVQP